MAGPKPITGAGNAQGGAQGITPSSSTIKKEEAFSQASDAGRLKRAPKVLESNDPGYTPPPRHDLRPLMITRHKFQRTQFEVDRPGLRSPTYTTNFSEEFHNRFSGKMVPHELIQPSTQAAQRLEILGSIEEISGMVDRGDFRGALEAQEVQRRLEALKSLISARSPDIDRICKKAINLYDELPSFMNTTTVDNLLRKQAGEPLTHTGYKFPEGLIQAIGLLKEARDHKELSLPNIEDRVSRLPTKFKERDVAKTFVSAIGNFLSMAVFARKAAPSLNKANIAVASYSIWHASEGQPRPERAFAREARMLAVSGVHGNKTRELADHMQDKAAGDFGMIDPTYIPDQSELLGPPILIERKDGGVAPNAANLSVPSHVIMCRFVAGHYSEQGT